MENFSELTTEKINPATAHIDKCATLEMVKLINRFKNDIAEGNPEVADLIFIP